MSFSGHFFETGRGLRWRGGREERIQVDHANALSVLKLDTLTPQYFTTGEDNRKRMRGPRTAEPQNPGRKRQFIGS